MEAALSTLEKALAYLNNFMTTLVTILGEPLVLVASGVFFILGLFVFYKKGPWLGIPISLAGILLIVMAILRELFTF